MLWGLRFLQQCGWRFKSCRTCHCVIRQVVSNISKDSGAFLGCLPFKMKALQSFRTLVTTFQNTNLVHNSFNIQQYICYTTLLNMFRAARCSSSGGPIVSPQPLVSSLFTNSRTVCGWRADCSPLSTRILYGCLQRVTIPEAVVIQLVLLMMSSVLLETCWWV